MSLNIVIVGGHGRIALPLTRLAVTKGHVVTSIIRNSIQSQTILDAGATPHVLSLEHAPISDFTALFAQAKADVVYFTAGAGDLDHEDRIKAIDYQGATKVFDAIEALNGSRPRLIQISGLDVGNEDRFPEHYSEEDKALISHARDQLAGWYKWNYEADKDLIKRTSFEWIVLRPGLLNDEPAAGKAAIGRTHLGYVSREDVARALLYLASAPSKASRLSIDMISGEDEIESALGVFIERGVTDWLGPV